MGEVLTRREEVAAKRAALTDGRWRNREGVGMYQRSTSNALREMLSELKPAQSTQPSKPRARTKSRSRSRSPKKRKSIAVPVEPALPIDHSRIQTNNVPEHSTPKSPVRLVTSAPPSRRSSFASAPQSLPSPVPQPKPTSSAKPKSKPGIKPSSKAKSKQKASRNDDSEPEATVANLLKQRRAKIAEEEAQQATANLDEGDEQVAEDIPMEVPGPSTSTKSTTTKVPAAKAKPRMEEIEDSVVILQEDQEEERPNTPQTKPKSRIQTIIPESTQPTKSKPKKRIEDPKHNPKPVAKSKGKAPRGKKKGVEEDEECDEEVVVRKVSGKRPARSDDEDEDNDDYLGAKDDSRPSTSKRTKTKPNPPKKSKAKPKAKSKPRKPAKSASTSASTSKSYHSAPESPELPEARDIMVPLQDSPRPKSKSNRRRYTLMPIRTEAEMADPDYDPIDCIGFGFAAAP